MKEVTQQFLQRAGVKQLVQMFDLLPGVLFWVKDAEHKFVYANHSFLEHHKLKTAEQVVGLSDYDLTPSHIAQQFVRDDEQILLGSSVSERLEMNVDNSGKTAWYSTSKRPIYNKNTIIGSYGITRQLEKMAVTLSHLEAIKGPIDYIKQHYSQPISIEQLAQTAHLSVSALERRFKKHLHQTPKQFLNQYRLEQARKMLVESNLPISDIAELCGFGDHSYFSKQFRILFNQLPSVFRDSQPVS